MKGFASVNANLNEGGYVLRRECAQGKTLIRPTKDFEGGPQRFGQGEDELQVGEGKEQLLIEVHGEQECSLLAAGWTEVEALAGKGTEVLMAAFRVHTSNAGHALAALAA